MPRLLIVAADPRVLHSLERGLRAQGHEVTTATSGAGAFVLATAQPFDGLVLDLCRPDGEGLRILADLRRAGKCLPVLILMPRAAVETQLPALGANTDYLAKPITLGELNARLQALLDRDRTPREPDLEAGDLRMDGRRRRVLLGGVEIPLTRREFDLLECLLRHKNMPVTRHTLGSQVWHEPDGTGTNVIEVYINILRRKLERVGRRSLIQTVRGVGYKLQDAT
jgi:DNA-binding response OmpR family regulator